ncbi:MAG TPA: mannose-1-phosphate guanylyltransferase/mannose-6-phosphate isomerase [Rhizorhapis sp.]
MSQDPMIVPVILSGGSGTRLWPLSRPEMPKQLLALTARESMMQLTAKRTAARSDCAPPLIVASARHADLIQDQLAAVGEQRAKLILEPMGRNTAPAIALAALMVETPAAPLLVMPSDHVIIDLPAFYEAIDRALPLVREGWLVTFGVTPETPETGYGYIKMAETLCEGVQRVEHFVEKPDTETARAMLAEGGYAWNAGIFMFRADAYLRELQIHRPEMLAAARRSMEAAVVKGNQIVPDSDQFAACPSDSIDYAIMEKAERVAVVPVSMGWSDVGSWDSLYALRECDEVGNAHSGEVIAVDTQNCLVHSDGARVALVGVKDLIVVASGNDILIMPRGQSQDVRKVMKAMKDKDLKDGL